MIHDAKRHLKTAIGIGDASTPGKRALAIAAVALFAAIASPASAAPEGAGQAAPGPLAADPDVAASARLFSAWLENHIAYRGLPGVVVGVVHDQQLVWSGAFGHADTGRKLPMTTDTKFRMASHTKMLTAIAIMQLREQGKLRLDDPVIGHLPWFKVQPAGADDGPIIVEQLLSHSSGVQREASDHWSSLDFPTSAELKTLTSDRQSAFAPSVRWKYSNLAYAVAGMLVEKASGEGFADYATANILQPLGMASSSFDRNVPDLATPYGRRLPDGTREVYPFVDARGMVAATGLTSTLGDMAHFVSAQFRRGPRGGNQILSSGSWREMHRVRSVEENWATGTGLGFAVQRIKDRSYVGHGGGYPGYTTQTLIQLDDKVGVVVLTNTQDSDPGDIARQAMAAFGPGIAKASGARASGDSAAQRLAFDAAWARFQGVYRGRSNDTAVVLMNGRLVLLLSSAPQVDSALKLEPLGDGRFRLEAPAGGVPVGEVVRFEEVPGKPVRLHIGDTWSDRVTPAPADAAR